VLHQEDDASLVGVVGDLSECVEVGVLPGLGILLG